MTQNKVDRICESIIHNQKMALLDWLASLEAEKSHNHCLQTGELGKSVAALPKKLGSSEQEGQMMKPQFRLKALESLVKVQVQRLINLDSDVHR
jgi:hypothetical protein